MKYYTFDDSILRNASEAIETHYADQDALSASATASAGSSILLAGGCIKVTIENHKVCLDLPLGLGKHCLPIPINFPNGTAAEACIDLCYIWKIPTGVKVSVKVAGVTVVSQSFGKC